MLSFISYLVTRSSFIKKDGGNMAEQPAVDAMDSMVVTTADFNEDEYRLLQLNPEIEQAITTGSKCVASSYHLQKRALKNGYILADNHFIMPMLQGLHRWRTRFQSGAVYRGQVLLHQERRHVEPPPAHYALGLERTGRHHWQEDDRSLGSRSLPLPGRLLMLSKRLQLLLMDTLPSVA
jgi:hypothetical protein